MMMNKESSPGDLSSGESIEVVTKEVTVHHYMSPVTYFNASFLLISIILLGIAFRRKSSTSPGILLTGFVFLAAELIIASIGIFLIPTPLMMNFSIAIGVLGWMFIT
jgi:hypothetical protein